MDDTGDGRWLTYAELGAIRGINRASAVKLVQRERWPRSSGNDGAKTVRVLVPEDWLQSAKERPPSSGDRADGSGEYAGMLAVIEAAHAGEIAALQGALADVEGAGRAGRAGGCRRAVRADALRDRLDEAQDKLRQAQDAAEALRRAEVERQARGLLRGSERRGGGNRRFCRCVCPLLNN